MDALPNPVPRGKVAKTVVVLNDFCNVQGGASKVAIEEAIALAHGGLRVIFIGAVGPVCAALHDAPLETICLEQPELLGVMKNPSVVLQTLWNVMAYRRTAALLRTLNPKETVVHLHGYTKALTTSPAQAARRLGFPVVCTLHDFYAACPNGAFFDYRAQAPCTKRGLSAACVGTNCDKRHYAHKLFRVVRGFAQREIARFPRSVGHYIQLSHQSGTILTPYLPADARLHALSNVTDVDLQPPCNPAQSEVLVCVGRLDVEKGVELLAETAQRLGKPIVFVGDGPLRGKIESMPGMTVTGWLDKADVQRHLASARCLIFPSLWYETYGLVVAEAAAIGIPAIVSDISAASERVIDGTTGWHFRNGDTADLGRCLDLVDSDSAVHAAGRAAYAAFWANPPTRLNHVDGLLNIYEQALNT